MDKNSPDTPITALETLHTLADEIRRLVKKYPDSASELDALGDAIEELDKEGPEKTDN